MHDKPAPLCTCPTTIMTERNIYEIRCVVTGHIPRGCNGHTRLAQTEPRFVSVSVDLRRMMNDDDQTSEGNRVVAL